MDRACAMIPNLASSRIWIEIRSPPAGALTPHIAERDASSVLLRLQWPLNLHGLGGLASCCAVRLNSWALPSGGSR